MADTLRARSAVSASALGHRFGRRLGACCLHGSPSKPSEGSALRIAHLDHSHEPGGAELALRRLVLRAPWDAHVFVPDELVPTSVWRSGSTVGSAVLVGVGPSQLPMNGQHRLRRSRVLVSTLAMALALVRNPEFRGCDVVHANTARATLYGALAAAITGKPLVVHLRDRVEREALGTTGASIVAHICKRRAALVIANSEATLATLRQRSPRVAHRVLRSHHGVRRVPVPPPVARDDEGVAVLQVGMVARLAEWKGQDLLLEAGDLLARRGVEARIEVVGGPAFESTEFAQRLASSARAVRRGCEVVFVGHVEDVVQYIDRWDVAVQASRRAEPLGQNVMQYMSRGRATVVSGEGGPAELVEDGRTGLHFEPRNAASLADAMQRLTDPVLRSQVARAGWEAAAAFDEDVLTRDYADVFDMASSRSSKSTSGCTVRTAGSLYAGSRRRWAALGWLRSRVLRRRTR